MSDSQPIVTGATNGRGREILPFSRATADPAETGCRTAYTLRSHDADDVGTGPYKTAA